MDDETRVNIPAGLSGAGVGVGPEWAPASAWAREWPSGLAWPWAPVLMWQQGSEWALERTLVEGRASPWGWCLRKPTR